MSFVGNWSGNTAYMKSHTQRKLGLYLSCLASVKNDLVIETNEYGSTTTYCPCFKRNIKLIVRREAKLVKLKGTFVRVNPSCPRQVASRLITLNGDHDGALNIALIGFNSLK
jgi:hypothetical protein